MAAGTAACPAVRSPGAWSVAECLDHLATADRVDLAALRPAAERARQQGRRRASVNPFIRGVRFSLATGLHVIAAHERRHLWQAARAPGRRR